MQPEAFRLLADFAWLTDVEVYQATPHCLAPEIIPFGQEEVQISLGEMHALPLCVNTEHLIPQHQLRFCPMCLAQEPYHRLEWLPRLVTVCTRHQCLLLEHCPGCGSPVDMSSLLDAQCRHCQASLTAVEPIDLAQDEEGLLSQRLIRTWLLDKRGSSSSGWSLVDLAPRAAYHFLHDLSTVPGIEALDNTASLTEDEAIAPCFNTTWQQYRLTAVAVRALLDWPLGFYELLDAYRVAHTGLYRPHGPLKDLGAIYLRLQRSWCYPEFQAVHDAFDDYFVQNYDRSFKVRKSQWYLERPGVAAQFRFITTTEAADRLQVAPQSLSKLVRTGRLKRYPALDADRWLYLRTEVQALATVWSQTCTLAETAELTGLSEAVVRELITQAVLLADRGPTTDEAAQWQISQASIQQFRVNLSLRALPLAAAEGLVVDLATATRMLAVVGFDLVRVIRALLDGELLAFGGERPGDLLLSELDIRRLVEVVKQRNRWVNRETIARRMGVKDTVVARWIRNGLITPVATHATAQYFDAEAVEQFCEGHIFTETAATLLGIGQLTVQRWAQKGRLKPVSGPHLDGCHRYLFVKQEVLQWSRHDFITTPELARHLGMSLSQVLVWVRQGRLCPVSGPGVDQCRQYLFERPHD